MLLYFTQLPNTFRCSFIHFCTAKSYHIGNMRWSWKIFGDSRFWKWKLYNNLEHQQVVSLNRTLGNYFWLICSSVPIRIIFNANPTSGTAILSFSPSGKYLVSLSDENPQNVQLWMWTIGNDGPDGKYYFQKFHIYNENSKISILL